MPKYRIIHVLVESTTHKTSQDLQTLQVNYTNQYYEVQKYTLWRWKTLRTYDKLNAAISLYDILVHKPQHKETITTIHPK